MGKRPIRSRKNRVVKRKRRNTKRRKYKGGGVSINLDNFEINRILTHIPPDFLSDSLDEYSKTEKMSDETRIQAQIAIEDKIKRTMDPFLAILINAIDSLTFNDMMNESLTLKEIETQTETIEKVKKDLFLKNNTSGTFQISDESTFERFKTFLLEDYLGVKGFYTADVKGRHGVDLHKKGHVLYAGTFTVHDIEHLKYLKNAFELKENGNLNKAFALFAIKEINGLKTEKEKKDAIAASQRVADAYNANFRV